LSTYLLLDIGNSNIKAGISTPDRIKIIKNSGYSLIDVIEYVKSIIKKHHSPFEYIGVSTNNKSFRKNLGRYFQDKGLRNLFVRDKIKLPIKIKYNDPLGADRISGAAGASYSYLDHKNILYIDFGTATTINLISDKCFLGGMIAPGILTSLKSLNDNTNLPEIEYSYKSSLINRDTKSNIQAGIYYQTLYFIERTITEIRKKYKSLYVIATGGLGETIQRKTKLIDVYDRYLVLKGIHTILKYNDNV